MSSPPHLYPTDLTDAEWAILERLIPAPKPGGRPPKWSRYELSYMADPDQRQLQKLMDGVRAARAAQLMQGR